MSINLTVILGAGAAVDVVNVSSHDVNEAALRPPVTAGIFKTHRGWEKEYISFPGVANVLSEIRRLADPNPQSLEGFLKSLKDSTDSFRRRQFRQFSLYLQHYFTAVTDRYCVKPSNYFALLNGVLTAKFEKVAFLTLNYDLLFDKALYHHLETDYSISSEDMGKYIPGQRWMYIKLHGSIDWGRRIKEDKIKNRSSTLPGLLDNVNKLGDGLEDALEAEIIRDKRYNDQLSRELIYPAISVPVGESKLNCRPEHVEALEKHLDNCSHYLIIGFSGYDTDVLELLDKKKGSFGRVMVVSSTEKAALDTREKIMGYGSLSSKLQMHVDIYKGNGFDEFVRSHSGLDAYLSMLL